MGGAGEIDYCQALDIGTRDSLGWHGAWVEDVMVPPLALDKALVPSAHPSRIVLALACMHAVALLWPIFADPTSKVQAAMPCSMSFCPNRPPPPPPTSD